MDIESIVKTQQLIDKVLLAKRIAKEPEEYYIDTFLKFLLLDGYGRAHIQQSRVKKEFGEWLKSQRKGLNKDEIKENNLDIYPKSGSYTLSQIKSFLYDCDLIHTYDNSFTLTKEGHDYVIGLIINDLNDCKSWLEEYYVACSNITNLNLCNDLSWLITHYNNGSNPTKLGSLALGDVAEETFLKVKEHIELQNSESINLLLQPKLLLDYELAGIDRSLIKCRVIIESLEYDEVFIHSFSPFPNKRIVIAQINDSIFFKALPIAKGIKEVEVKYIWSISELEVVHTIKYSLIGNKGICFFDSINSFITYNLSPESNVDLDYIRFKYPDLISLDIDPEKQVIHIKECKELRLLYPSNHPFRLSYLPTSKYN